MRPKENGMRIRSLTACLIVALLACGSALAEKRAVKRVESKKVCMITEAVYEKDQIPVTVDGKTYYGCCDMCKEMLAKDPTKRVATDPVSGKPVDKAEAVIGELPDGKVLFFESEKSLEVYAGGE
jgi:YHS domain-containing protein